MGDINVNGFSVSRLEQDNPREVAFHDQWAVENNTDYRRCLIGGLIPDFTQRDEIVAATIIQWLGSNVGFCFLQESLKRCGYQIKTGWGVSGGGRNAPSYLS